jgi:hypothetical protein
LDWRLCERDDPARIYIGGEITAAWDPSSHRARGIEERALTPRRGHGHPPVAASEHPARAARPRLCRRRLRAGGGVIAGFQESRVPGSSTQVLESIANGTHRA